MSPRKIIIIGGGPAGMMAAIKAAQTLRDSGFAAGRDADIVLYDKNDRLGRKIYLTGKGRCNITNMKTWEEFSTHIHPNREFLKHSFRIFSNEDVRDFFEGIGVPTTIEQGQRLFPVSMKASDVAQALERKVHELGVNVETCRLEHLPEPSSDCAVILATGGKSYPLTGSTGDGYAMAREAGHTVSRTFPSLTALMPEGYDLSLDGLTLKNVSLCLYVDRTMVQSEEGELTFTADGIEGALGFRLSRKAVWALENGQKVELSLDLKPALSEDKISSRILRETASRASRGDGKVTSSLLRSMMPEQLVEPFIRANQGLTFDNLPQRLKDWRFRISSCKGYERAVVTAGGVSLKEIVPKTLASRLVEGLFFAGEVIDLDGDTGGYNLQIAFSTGATAGISAAKFLAR